ncbi:MAG: hypothetical protein ACJ790_00175, partial [Myxococcaceae bacterium]
MRWAAVSALLVASACTCNEKPAPPLSSLKPAPLPDVRPARPSDGGDDREAAYQVAPATAYGAWQFKAEDVVHLTDKGAEWQGKSFSFEDPALLSSVAATDRVTVTWDEGVYLAQAAPLFAALDDGGKSFQLVADRLGTAYAPRLRDETAFGL